MRPWAILGILLLLAPPSFAQVFYGPAPSPLQVPYDVQFLDTLAHHNRASINLMQLGQERALNPQVKAVAQQILYARRGGASLH